MQNFITSQKTIINKSFTCQQHFNALIERRQQLIDYRDTVLKEINSQTQLRAEQTKELQNLKSLKEVFGFESQLTLSDNYIHLKRSYLELKFAISRWEGQLLKQNQEKSVLNKALQLQYGQKQKALDFLIQNKQSLEKILSTLRRLRQSVLSKQRLNLFDKIQKLSFSQTAEEQPLNLQILQKVNCQLQTIMTIYESEYKILGRQETVFDNGPKITTGSQSTIESQTEVFAKQKLLNNYKKESQLTVETKNKQNRSQLYFSGTQLKNGQLTLKKDKAEKELERLRRQKRQLMGVNHRERRKMEKLGQKLKKISQNYESFRISRVISRITA